MYVERGIACFFLIKELNMYVYRKRVLLLSLKNKLLLGSQGCIK